jgi:hypothetical protein
MICLSCQHDNRAAAKFCEACGSKLESACPACGTVLRPTARFCDNCGASLTANAQTKRPTDTQTEKLTDSPQRPPVSYTPTHLADRIRAVTVVDGERKTITAVFADLKGSTALIEDLDPEEARAIIDPALQLMMDAVHQSPPRREGVAATACRYWPTISLESDPPGDCPA